MADVGTQELKEVGTKPEVNEVDLLKRSLHMAHEKIEALEAQLALCHQAACVVLGFDYNQLFQKDEK